MTRDILSGLNKLIGEFKQEADQRGKQEANQRRRNEETGIHYTPNIKSVLQMKQSLGKGAQASVVSAILLSTGKEVAVKIESKQMSDKARIHFDVCSYHRRDA